MNFKDYYKKLGETQSLLKNKIMTSLEIGEKTFYNKVNADSWSALERAEVEKITLDHINDLNSISL